MLLLHMESSEAERIRIDGEQALAHYFESYEPRLRKMIAIRLSPRISSRVDPDDILQDTYVEAAKRLGDYLADPSVPLFVWIRFLVGQRVLAAHRFHLQQKRNAVREAYQSTTQPEIQRLWLLNQIVGSDTTPSLVVARQEMQTSLRKLIDSLDPTDREILCLRHLEELSNEETAAELSITPAAASKRYTRALVKLRNTAGDFESALF